MYRYPVHVVYSSILQQCSCSTFTKFSSSTAVCSTSSIYTYTKFSSSCTRGLRLPIRVLNLVRGTAVYGRTYKVRSPRSTKFSTLDLVP